jgi:hypothetical protein
MDREHVLIVRPELHEPRYADHSEILPELYRRIQERIQALPGVRSAAVEMCGGIHCGWITARYVHGRSDLTDAQVHGQEDHVGPGFFSTLGIPILHGRFLFERHGQNAACGDHQPRVCAPIVGEMRTRLANGLVMYRHQMITNL